MDCDARTLPLRADPNLTRITYHEPTEGCCLPMPCFACAKGRDYNRINEDSIETNRTCYQCFTCDTFDSVHKTYLDMNPFKPTCFGLCKPQFTSYKDSMYFLYFSHLMYWIYVIDLITHTAIGAPKSQGSRAARSLLYWFSCCA